MVHELFCLDLHLFRMSPFLRKYEVIGSLKISMMNTSRYSVTVKTIRRIILVEGKSEAVKDHQAVTAS